VKVALLGAGGINGLVAQASLEGKLPEIEVVAVAGSTADSSSARALADRLDAAAVAPEHLANVGCNWVLEAAGGAAVRAHIPRLWRQNINTIVMSVGALVDEDVYATYLEARSAGVAVLLPSGGIAGLDGVRALAAGGGLRSVSITTTKAPSGLRGAPYLVEGGIDLPDDEAITVFDGSAREAVAGFPANVNVAIALSLAGLGPDATRVVIRSDPQAKRTLQSISAEGDAASLDIQVASRPSPINPRTSYLAGASAVAALYEASQLPV
jgi:aspartate dehydrogenase